MCYLIEEIKILTLGVFFFFYNFTGKVSRITIKTRECITSKTLNWRIPRVLNVQMNVYWLGSCWWFSSGCRKIIICFDLWFGIIFTLVLRHGFCLLKTDRYINLPLFPHTFPCGYKINYKYFYIKLRSVCSLSDAWSFIRPLKTFRNQGTPRAWSEDWR